MPVTTNVSSNSAHGEVCSIQHYVIMFVNDLLQVHGVLWVLWILPPVKLPATVESGIKHHSPQPILTRQEENFWMKPSRKYILKTFNLEYSEYILMFWGYAIILHLLLYQHFKDISALEISGSYNFTKIENIKTMVKPLNAYEYFIHCKCIYNQVQWNLTKPESCIKLSPNVRNLC